MKSSSPHQLPMLLAALACLGLTIATAHAAPVTTHLEEDFEGQTVGNELADDNNPWNHTPGNAGTTYTVVDNNTVTPPTGGGSNVLEALRDGTGEILIGFTPVGLSLSPYQSVTVSFDVRRSFPGPDGNTGNTAGILFVSDNNSASNTGARLELIGNTGFRYVDYNDGSGGQGTSGTTSSQSSLSPNAWANVEVVFTVAPAATITHNIAITPAGGSTSVIATGGLSHADFSVGDDLRLNWSPQGTNSQVYFDNVLVTSTIPEPGALGLVGLGALAVLARRHSAR